MKRLFDELALDCSRKVTKKYSTSFSLAVRMLSEDIRQDIHNIYGFVRFADEIVDSFHNYSQEVLFEEFSLELDKALERKISMNPILNSFQNTVHKYNIDRAMIDSFMESMRMDLHKKDYVVEENYKKYIYGSADVVGLMCLKVFVLGDEEKYSALKDSAMRLGSAFQKVNFLRDFKDDKETLERSYFPDIRSGVLTEESKASIIEEIEDDFKASLVGIKQLPMSARFGVYSAYMYYKSLLNSLKKYPAQRIMNERVRVSNPNKAFLLLRSYVSNQLNIF